jgi:hypothetical protein
MSSNSQFDSADKILEEYQKKLKHIQKIKGISSTKHSLDKNIIDNECEFKGDSLKAGEFVDSIGSLESQLINQFREYKTITKKLEEVKKELYLSNQIQVSIHAYNELKHAVKERNLKLEQEFLEKKTLLEQDLEILAEKKKGLINKNDIFFNDLENNQQFKFYLNSVKVESDLCLKFENMQFDFLDLKTNFTQQKNSLRLNFSAKKEGYKSRIEELDSSFNTIRIDFDKRKLELEKMYEVIEGSKLAAIDEQIQCVEFEFSNLRSHFEHKIYQLEDKVNLNEGTLTKRYLEFTDQLNQKKQLWENEKVSFYEDISLEKFQWSQDKSLMLTEIESKRMSFDSDIEKFEKDKIQRELLWKEKQKNFLEDLTKKQDTLNTGIYNLNSEIELLNLKKNSKLESIESFNMVLFEKESYLQFKLNLIENEVSLKRRILISNLDEEVEKNRSLHMLQLNKINDKQGIELSVRLTSFEEDLLKRKQAFEEELVQKRQKLILESKREQKLEFDHVLEFEKSKFVKQIEGLSDQLNDKNFEIKNLEQKVIDQKTNFETNIDDILNENDSLSKELVEVENLTRKSVIGNYEERYKNLLDSFKSQSAKEIKQLKKMVASKDISIRNKDLQLRDFQLSIKKLESELNRQIIKDSTSADETYTFTKVIRSKDRKY